MQPTRLEREVANATGEDVATIRHLGFTPLAEPTVVAPDLVATFAMDASTPPRQPAVPTKP
jgi:hypothetical protein